MRPRPLALQSLIAQLAALPGVDRVVIDDRATVVVLICTPGASRDQLAQAAARSLSDLGLVGLDIEVTVRSGEHRQGRRIRFVRVSRAERPDRAVELTVHLEWEGVEVTSSAVSQPGEAPELRGVASASLQAITRIVGRELGLRVAGIKRVRSFDADLMVASLFRAGPPRQQLVGAVVVGDDPPRAAAIAVLNALNRLLGNYLDR
ncbi:MAG: hypothetical protein FIB01_13430 [Gemmatimonadetes bacterium]|nr:hypothetical protein [Gemmatimonadota bacterium]